MSTPTRLAAFTAALAVVFASALGIGRAVGPVIDAPAPQHETTHGTEHAP